MEKVLLPMFESMDIEQEAKIELQEAFDNAVLAKTTEKLDEYVETQMNEKEEILKEEYKEKLELLESSLDGYLDSVVTDFISENAPSYEAQIADEKTKSLLEMFDKMCVLAGTEMLSIQENKTQIDEAAYEETAEYRVQGLEAKVSDMADKLAESNREADKYLKDGLINEMKEDLSILEGEKFEKIAGLVPFDRSKSYLDKLETLKESIIDSRVEGATKEEEGVLPTVAFRQPEQVDVKDALNFDQYL